MECENVREALSANLDGEDPGVPEAAMAAHLRSCESCAWLHGAMEGLHRWSRVRAVEPVPDLTAAILAATAPAVPRPAPRPEPAAGGWARWGLAVVALAHLVLALPALLAGDAAGASVHEARELGAWAAALGVALFAAACQPGRAWGLLPLAVALAALQLGAAAVDVLAGNATIIAESHHLLEVAGVGLLWLVARQGPARPVPSLKAPVPRPA